MSEGLAQGAERDRFVPLSPEAARETAKRAAQAYSKLNPEERWNDCELCESELREEIDYQILVNSTMPQRGLALTRAGIDFKNWNYKKYKNHRDRHLLPLIANVINITSQSVRALPYPKDGTTQEKKYWYYTQTAYLYSEARDNGSIVAALSCLKHMEELDEGLSKLQEMKSANLMLSPPEEEGELVEEEQQNNARLLAAFEKSRIRKKNFDPQEESDDEDE